MKVNSPREIVSSLVVTLAFRYGLAFLYTRNTATQVVSLPEDGVWVLQYFVSNEPLLAAVLFGLALVISLFFYVGPRERPAHHRRLNEFPAR
ncbi:hypothetical protein E6P09_08835 [Haloferax mediterranei ATCC 33500]|uniref:Uncharacterized protein n=1 Tax=Haloferax mediterranei (strain ATCC 33500 / DSM 1411 / JCM 8866 / NBRC 14739 / NCIMB 2177 / R-4) TaxID=523841 RepID=M0J5I7_HALMT|nr:hypothetical protein [Haloferax mediterranei]AHZ21759.1 hypothetical protein BM92_03390 [Haloferax mediterranei ATCC 33500]EMA03264.1 hypothetical protein C439_04680 [Haloferax mediterranei ATCC 33500]MDX5988971.1 hypothetical protein [Haloferax mediterranei ATCC 33500]QCQ75364.1 hypothetical protein E6P09_08835 [Haloferax mediterranei ATCC 33500]